MKKNLSFIFLLMSMMFYAQQVTLKGVVKDNTGEPLPGAEIIVEETGAGTVTDFDGRFTIKVEKGNHIKVRYLGYKPKTVMVTSDSMAIILEPDAVGLQQVVITGVSGEGTKKQLGSTINTLKADDLGQREVTSITEALQGQLAGAFITRNNGSPEGSISVRLRGPSTILGSSEPLIMVDGVIINADDRSIPGLGSATQSALTDLDLEDIERIEVLKGPAASAVYGSIASNGIINIITKKGRTGTPTVTFTSKFNYNEVRKYKPLNKVKLYKNTNTGTIENLPASVNGTQLDRYDWGKEYIFDKTFGYYNSLEVKGGTEKTKYVISGALLSNDGVLRNTNFSRQNFRLKLDQKINEWVNVTGNVYLASSASKEIPFGNGWVANPMIAYMFGDNMVNPYPNNVGVYPFIKKLPATDPNGGLYYLDYTSGGQARWGNPYEAIDLADVGVKNNRIIYNIALNVSPVGGLKLKYTFGYDYASSKRHFNLPYNFTSDANGRISYTNTFTKILNSAFDASYVWNINDDLKSTTGVGYNYLYRGLDVFSMSQNARTIFDNITVITGDNPVSTGVYERALWGGYLQQVFGYKETFFVTLAGRYDGASTFGKENRNQFYPKASTSLVLSNLDFFKDNFGKYIDEFKLRAAYGEAGNLSVLDSPSLNYTYQGTLYNSGDYLGQTIYLPSTADGNKKIRPERTKEFEAGFDMSIFNNKLGIEFTYYKQDVKDLVLNRVLAPSTGFTSRFENVGSMTNEGIELSINATPVQTNDFKWDIRATYSTNKNRAYDVPGHRIGFGGFGANSSVVQEGYPIGSFFVYYYATDANGNWVLDPNGNPQPARGHYEDRDGDGFAETPVQDFDPITGQPVGQKLRKIMGDPHPDFIASLAQTFRYKNFSLRIMMDAVWGFEVLNWDKRMAYKFPIGEFYGEELQLVKSGQKNPGWYKNRFSIWESFLEDGSFVKLREVSLSYRWKPEWKYVRSVRFTLTGSNLLSFDKYWGMDPEVNYMGKSNVTRSQDFGGVPIPRVYSLGININL